MAVCTLAIPPDTELVRVARLVATAAARRVGMPEDRIDDVRLAVGEAVGRAVVRQQRAGRMEPVRVRLVTQGGEFAVEVADSAAGVGPDESRLALDLIAGLAPVVRLDDASGSGDVIRMQWADAEADEDL